MQTDTILAADSASGANNIKVASVADFAAGQTIIIDTGANRETAVIATVGTAGGTTVALPPRRARPLSLSPARLALAPARPSPLTVARTWRRRWSPPSPAAAGGRGGFGGFGGGRGGFGGASITVAAPLKMAHAEEAQVSGSGITLTSALTKAHESGAPVGGSVPTPGAPNQYARRAQ